MVQQILPTNTFTTAKWIVSATASDGTHTTIAAALTAASSGDTIFIRPGTYTENPTLKAGVNLAAYDADATTPNVIINGKCTFSSAGTVSLSGISLQTNSDFCLAITGSAASIVTLTNCFINGLNNTAISYTSSSASSQLNLNYCTGNLATTGIALFSASTGGTFNCIHSSFNNTGNSTTANTCASTGTYSFSYSSINNPITTSNTAAFSGNNLLIVCSAINTTAFTHNSTLGQGALRQSQLLSGTATALSVAASALIELIHVELDSSNASTISNSGTVQYTIIQAGTTTALTLGGGGTYTKLATQPAILSSAGAWTLLQTQTASSSASIAFTSTYITNTYENYAVIMSNVVPATTGVSFSMTVSTNNGSGYLNTGYNANAGVCSSAGGSINSTNSTTAIPFNYSGNLLKNTAGVGLSGVMYLTNWTSGSNTPQVAGNGQYLENSSGVLVLALWGGTAPASSAINNIKFAMSSGNISTGTFSLYGISS
jgi:hypothetical protein